MRKNQVRSVVIHAAEEVDASKLAGQIGRFHAAVIERRILQSGLPPHQQLALIERILEKRRAQERAAADP